MNIKILKGKGEKPTFREWVSIPLSAAHAMFLDRIISRSNQNGLPLSRSDALLIVLDTIQDSSRASTPEGR